MSYFFIYKLIGIIHTPMVRQQYVGRKPAVPKGKPRPSAGCVMIIHLPFIYVTSDLSWNLQRAHEDNITTSGTSTCMLQLQVFKGFCVLYVGRQIHSRIIWSKQRLRKIHLFKGPLVVKGLFSTLSLIALLNNMPRSSSVGKMDQCCPNCGETFVRITKGYRRFKISSRFTPATAKALFPSLPRHSVICDICCNEQDTVTVPVGKRSRKRRLAEGVDVAAASLSSPLKKRPSVAQPPAQVATDIPVRRPKYINYLKTSKYKLAFRSLLRENGRRSRAKAAMVSVVAELLKKEVSRPTENISGKCTPKSHCFLRTWWS